MATKNNKEININTLLPIKPITDNQKIVFDTWKKGKNQFLFGYLVKDALVGRFVLWSDTALISNLRR